jgi:hypothetical protein
VKFNAPLSDERAAQRKPEYEQHYRGGLGFAWLVLDRAPRA